MNPSAFLPSAVLVGGALFCLLLEAVGAPPGSRKRLERVHLAWLVGGTCLGAGFAARGAWQQGALDATSLVGVLTLLALVAVTHVAAGRFLRSIDEERGELSAAYLLFGAGMCAVASSTHSLVVCAGLVLAGVAGAFLSAPDRDGPHGIEAAARLVVSVGVLLTLGVLAATFAALASGSVDLTALAGATSPAARTGEALVLVLVAVLAGSAPLHQRFIDITHGAASSATGLLAAGGLVGGGALAVRLVDVAPATRLQEALSLLALVSLVGLPLAALAQVRVGRLVGYLAAAQVGAPLAALASSDAGHGQGEAMAAIVVGAGAAGAALLGVTLATRHPAATWEDWSGFGRNRPVVAALFLYALANCAGIPGTAGFLTRLSAARIAFSHGDDLLGLACVGGIAFAAAPVVRLALFLFAKTATSSRQSDAGTLALGFVSLVAASAGLAAVPGLLDVLARFIERGG